MPRALRSGRRRQARRRRSLQTLRQPRGAGPTARPRAPPVGPAVHRTKPRSVARSRSCPTSNTPSHWLDGQPPFFHRVGLADLVAQLLLHPLRQLVHGLDRQAREAGDLARGVTVERVLQIEPLAGVQPRQRLHDDSERLFQQGRFLLLEQIVLRGRYRKVSIAKKALIGRGYVDHLVGAMCFRKIAGWKRGPDPADPLAALRFCDLRLAGWEGRQQGRWVGYEPLPIKQTEDRLFQCGEMLNR